MLVAVSADRSFLDLGDYDFYFSYYFNDVIPKADRSFLDLGDYDLH